MRRLVQTGQEVPMFKAIMIPILLGLAVAMVLRAAVPRRV
jgi:hypothetical protein